MNRNGVIIAQDNKLRTLQGRAKVSWHALWAVEEESKSKMKIKIRKRIKRKSRIKIKTGPMTSDPAWGRSYSYSLSCS